MFLDNVDCEVLNEQYLTEEYAKGIMASDYISKIRTQCALMTYVPGFDKLKVKRMENLIEKYEDKLELAKKELAEYKAKSEDEKKKLEKLNRIDTVLSSGIKITVIILSVYISFGMAKVALPKLVETAKKITESKKIIAKLLRATKLPGLIVKNASTVAKLSKGVKVAKAAKSSIGEIGEASKTMKIGGYEAEIVRCIAEMEQLLKVLKNKKTMFEMELDKKEKGLR